MKIPIQRIKNNEKIKIDTYIKNADLGEQGTLITPIHIEGTLTYVGSEEVFFEGHLSATVELTCVKCLKKFKQNFEIDISESYIPQYFLNTAQGKEERDLEELRVLPYQNGVINIDKIARDILIENIPPYPLCPECRANQ